MTRRTRSTARSVLTRMALMTLLLLLAAAGARADASWSLPDGYALAPVDGGGFVVAQDRQYVLYHPDQPEPVCAFPAEDRWLHLTVYGDGDGTCWGLAYRRDDGAPGPTLRRLAFSEGKVIILESWALPEYFYLNAPPLVREDAIYLFEERHRFDEDDAKSDAPAFLRLDRATGAYTITRAPQDLRFVQPYRDGLFLGYQADWSPQNPQPNDVVSIDPVTGQTTPLLTLAHYPAAMAYCAETDQLAYALAPHVYACTLSTGETPTKQGYLPIQGDVVSPTVLLALNSDGVCAALQGDMLFCVTLDPAWEQRQQMLSIANFNSDRPETSRFRRARPDIPVETVNYSYHLTPSKVADILRTGDDTHDIFMQCTALSGFDTLLDRGFAAELSSSEVLTAWADDLAPAVRRAVSRDGRLMAVPTFVDFSSTNTLAYDPALLADFGIDPADLPGDIPSLLARLTQWYEDGTLTDIRVLETRPPQAQVLYNFALFTYTNYASYDGGWPDYQSPTFTALMAQCEALIAAMERQHCLDAGLPALFQKVSVEEWVNGDLDKQGLTFLPLSLAEGEAPLYFANVTAALMSPLSPRPEQAMTYLEAVAQDLDPIAAMYLCPDLAQTVEQAEYQERKARYLEQIEEYSSALKDPALLPDSYDFFEQMLSDTKRYLRDLEKDGHWIVSPDMLERARSIREQVVMDQEKVLQFNPDQANTMQYMQLSNRFFAGQLTIQQYVDELSRMAQIMQMEEN